MGVSHAGQAAVTDEGGAEPFADATLWSWWLNIGKQSNRPKKQRYTL